MMKYLCLVVVLSSVSAHAACVDEVDALTKHYGISSTLPKTPSSGTSGNAAATSDKLAASGGVIAPPSTGDTANVAPAVPNPDAGMATAPSIAPQTAEGETETHKGTGEHAAAENSQAAAVLMAARQAGVQGQESTCEEGLAKARGLLGK
jgi:hypothetical protein